MTRVVKVGQVLDTTLEQILAPRQGAVGEHQVGAGHFVGVDGPFRCYRRQVEHWSAAPNPRGQGVWRVRQTVEYDLAIPWFSWLFSLPLRFELGRLAPRRAGMAWWLPPARLSPAGASTLAYLAMVSMVVGYLGTLLTQTVTFAAREFGASSGAQGLVLASVRTDVVLALAVVTVADRRGRVKILVLAAGLACVITAAGAGAGSLATLAASQVPARGLATAAGILISIVAVEEMPAGARAYALSLLAMSAALGAGVSVIELSICDLAPGAWRVEYLVGLVGLVVLVPVARRLPESRRFTIPHPPASFRGHGGRLGLLAATQFLLNAFIVPASQFQNQYLRTERGFSAARVSLFNLAIYTPGGLGVVAGGRLSDTRGRRVVAMVGLVGGAGATTASYLIHGAGMWATALVGVILGAVLIPSLGVYGPEMFPTALRGRANGVLTAAGRLGSVVGLVTAGSLSGVLGGLGHPLAILAVGPLVLVGVVALFYPETAGVELEDLNPADP